MKKQAKGDTTGAKRQSHRYAVLNQKARAAGWSSWAAYCTAVINGVVNLQSNNTTNTNRDGGQKARRVGKALGG